MKQHIVYGPVLSRRLGISLGINLLPLDKKICSLDCLYCECGWTQIHTNISSGIEGFPKVSDVRDSLINKILDSRINIEHLTFAGNGEPTLHPDFQLIVDEIIKIRDKYLPETKIAILSNSTTLDSKEIRDSISKLDVPILKLDAGNEETFIKYNRPAKNIKFSEIISGLLQLNNIIIQSLFTGGKKGNYNEKNISDWIEILLRIKPNYVQIYSLDRNYPSDEILPIDKNNLLKIQTELEKYNIKAEVF